MTIRSDLPEYEKPPVVEVVSGLTFKPVQGLLVPHFGLLWEKFKPDYPTCQEVAPLVSRLEQFDKPPEVAFEVSDVPPLPRVWFVHRDGSGVIQVQRDRFLHNWRRTELDTEYPRYHNVIRMFKDRFSQFQSFLREARLGDLVPVQYEMTYVNQIPRGDGWEELGDIGDVFPDFSWREDSKRFLDTPESVDWRTTFTLPDRSGRLHVRIRNALRDSDRSPIILFELTARGIGEHTGQEAMWSWFDLAREWIVIGFTDLTGKKVQKDVWGRSK